jgi:hydroxymethylglutaryl-CoA lyase
LSRAHLHEVAPRDGLQNEKAVLPTADKLALVERLAAARPDTIEATSFVRPDLLPPLADAEAVCAGLRRAAWRDRVALYGLVANARGMERFLASGLDGVTLLVSSTEGHSRANVGMSVAEALEENLALAREARAAGHPVRAYVSMAFGCPFDGAPPAARVMELVAAWAEAGPEVLVLADTLGTGAVEQVEQLVGGALERVDGEHLGVHLHDTFGHAAENARRAWQLGVRHFDAAAGGAGGCPFAPGAKGNLDMAALAAALREEGAEFPLDGAALGEATRYLGESLARARTSA